MIRNISRLQHETFDVLVIGGGIYGSWIACHAAQAGLRTALVEQADWGSATSSASSKLLHGGLRYLERFEFGLVRKSLQERRELFQRMPHHVRPLKFLVPVCRGARIGRWRLGAGLWLYDLLSGSGQPVSSREAFSAVELLRREPSLSADDLVCGFSYGDCGTDDARMLLEVVESAQQADAVTCNYVRAESLLRERGRVVGAALQDVETGYSFDCSASLVVDAAGPWIFRDLHSEGSQPRIRRTKGVHLVMPKLHSEDAVLLTAKSDGRVFFLIPWYGRTLLGTTDTDYDGDPAAVCVEQDDVDYLLTSANDYLKTHWTVHDIHGAFAGLRTMLDDSDASASSVSREWHLDHSEPGLLTSIGGKYTSARIDGLSASKTIVSLLYGVSKQPASVEMAWYPADSFRKWQEQICIEAQAAGIDKETALNGTQRFGARFSQVIHFAENDPSLAERICPDLPFCLAEIVHAVRNEMARTLSDVLRRRVPLMLLTRLQRRTVVECCELMAEVSGWDVSRKNAETEAVMEAVNGWLPGEHVKKAA